MTLQEQKSIDSLLTEMRAFRNEQQEFKSQTNKTVELLSRKIDEKREPLSLERELIFSMKEAMNTAFTKVLSDSYNSPLKKYADNIVSKHQSSIESVFDSIVSEGIQTAQFKESVRVTFLNKLAKTVVSGIDGSVDKTINLMKQDAIFRSRLTLAVNGLVEEFLKQ